MTLTPPNHTNSAVRYRSFRVSAPDVRVIFEDQFDNADKSLSHWQGANPECSHLFYQREHMRRDKAPMLEKRRFVPEHTIKP